MAWEAVRTVLAPVPAEPGRGCARASSLKAHATVPPDLYGAWRVAALRDAGAWEMRDAAMAYTCARSTRLEHVQALPRKAHAAILLPPGPGGPAGAWRAYAILAGEGCAGRFAAGRGVDRPDGLSNRPGLRVPATPSVRREGAVSGR